MEETEPHTNYEWVEGDTKVLPLKVRPVHGMQVKNSLGETYTLIQVGTEWSAVHNEHVRLIRWRNSLTNFVIWLQNNKLYPVE